MIFSITDRETRALYKLLKKFSEDVDVYIKLNSTRRRGRLYIQERGYKLVLLFPVNIIQYKNYALKLPLRIFKEMLKTINSTSSPQIILEVVDNMHVKGTILSGTEPKEEIFEMQRIADTEEPILDLDILTAWKIPAQELLLSKAWVQRIPTNETEVTLFYTGDSIWEFQCDNLPPYMIKVTQQIGTIRSCKMYSKAVKFLFKLLNMLRGKGIVSINMYFLVYDFTFDQVKGKYYAPVWNMELT